MAVKALAGLAAMAAAYPVLSFVFFKKSREKRVTFPPDEQASLLLYKEGVFLINNKAEGATALSARCPHLGCTVNHDSLSGGFKCPCHGSTFDGQGRWISGPAGKDLARPAVSRKDSGEILVILKI